PYVYFAFCPLMLPSGDHPNPTVKAQRWPRWLNRLSWVINEWIWCRILIGTLNRARASRGLKPLRRIWNNLISARPIVACDPALAPAPSDWPGPPLDQPGAMFALERAPLSPEVSGFLDRGPPPVYLGFGSMSDRDPRATTARLLEAVRRTGVRAVVSRGWAGLDADQAPDGVLFIGPEPHGKLFPRCAAVVHHGGAGTTHAAARAGVPQVVMPHLLDQFYWAHRVALAGVGPGAVRRHTADPEPLAHAIRACVEDRGLQDRARALGARIAGDGADRAAQLLERVAAGERSARS
ncbi:MAG TPA: glycosyltransferase, partial [Myxococcaceae bacterium]